MFWETKLEKLVNGIRTTNPLPLRLELWTGQTYNLAPDVPPKVTVKVPNLDALGCFLKPTLDTLGSAYVEGKIDVDGSLQDIVGLANELADMFDAPESSTAAKFRHYFGGFHNRKIDAESIGYHYDVSNEFYQQWLDPNMVYSCGYFENEDDDLATAQIKKIDHILTKIKVQPGDRLLDIGCGWGALAIRAAEKFGANVVGITLSKNQYELARQRVKEKGLENKVDIRIQDYRDVKGSFERITSVGMFEHVGLRHLVEYFTIIRNLLTDDGLAMNHGITSCDAGSGATPFGGGEFIEKYVFPNGELPHIGLVLQNMQEAGLEALDIENLRMHYAKTCGIWAENFEKVTDKVKQLTDEKRYRIWRVYLAGCSYAFEADRVAIFQVLCTKSGKKYPAHGWNRNYIYQK
ncbi:MAG: class I SAM-dependent methyltransferase [Oxalobacter sp.]|nr:class I SAM-dependent methyltransferase [Oxalobacter sp.]